MERGGDRGGFGRGFGRGGRGDRGGRGRGGRRGGPRRDEEQKWIPVTKLGRLVQEGKIVSLEQIYLHSLPVKEHQIVESILGPQLKDEVMKIMPVQKQTRAGQRTRFKAFVVVGDGNGHVGLGIEDVFTSSRGSTKTLGNFVKATFNCLMKTYAFLTPDLWIETRFAKSPFQEYTDLLARPTKALLDDAEKVDA
ncbi:hypothetical protein HPP92_017645 [Vanilla planifolia]|uniref:40S ribosomal protein S2 n=1 Tax=Vanilla planifolia TaxID=51239 RepID=A0A835QFV2_VANPL|nr:hypothetical protein HPP92_017645 [Vanilla planifolia]